MEPLELTFRGLSLDRSLGFGCDRTTQMCVYDRLADPLYKRYEVVAKPSTAWSCIYLKCCFSQFRGRTYFFNFPSQYYSTIAHLTFHTLEIEFPSSTDVRPTLYRHDLSQNTGRPISVPASDERPLPVLADDSLAATASCTLLIFSTATKMFQLTGFMICYNFSINTFGSQACTLLKPFRQRRFMNKMASYP